MKVAKLTDTATIPTRKNSTDAGLDLYLDLKKTWGEMLPVVRAHEIRIAETGITVEIPEGFFGWITNKSGSDYLIGGGIVDQGYQGELLVKIINPTDEDIVFKHGQKIAQLLIIPCEILGIEEVSLNEIHQEKSDRSIDGGIRRQYTRNIDISDQYGYDFDPEDTVW
jgi:dUTP pyrophosphatase